MTELEELQKELKDCADDFVDERTSYSGYQEVGALIHRLLKKTESLPFLLKAVEGYAKEHKENVTKLAAAAKLDTENLQCVCNLCNYADAGLWRATGRQIDDEIGK